MTSRGRSFFGIALPSASNRWDYNLRKHPAKNINGHRNCMIAYNDVDDNRPGGIDLLKRSAPGRRFGH
jgi:hypothetical protein